MNCYDSLRPLYGDIHNHCGISYGHGPMEDALRNAAEQLDFCSITGHAHWPDMPDPDERIQYIIDFHREGFARLKAGWSEMLETIRKFDRNGEMVIFPGFEIHSNADGDRTILYQEIEGDILYANDLPDLYRRLAECRSKGIDVMSFPHHIGYRTGTRGINWETFDPDKEPFVEIISMHGCSESSEGSRPFLHSMGGSDWESTAQYGLSQGKIFGFSGNTDHHSGHPGSYGHGRTGVWANTKSREAIWDALQQRRMYALTGDRMELQFSVNDAPMGSILETKQKRSIEGVVRAGGAIDYVDVIKNNTLLRRISECNVVPHSPEATIRTRIYLELGWGERNKVTPWEIELGISDGTLLGIEPRFRGREVVSPVEQSGGVTDYFTSHWKKTGPRSVHFRTKSESNPNNFTSTTQGMCLDVELPIEASVQASINGTKEKIPIRRLIAGAKTGHLGGIDSPAWRFARAPLPHELNYRFSFTDDGRKGDYYYLRVRQKNDQWGWTSPVFLK